MSNGQTYYILQLTYPSSTNPQTAVALELPGMVFAGGSYSLTTSGAYMIQNTHRTVDASMAAGQQQLGLSSVISAATAELNGTLTATAALTVDVTLRLITGAGPSTIATLSAGDTSQQFSVSLRAREPGLSTEEVLAIFASQAAA